MTAKISNISFSYDETAEVCTMTVNNEEAGEIKLAGEDIMLAEIYDEFQGRGLYSMFLTAALNLSGKQVLYSTDRNEFSNPCYEKWTGNEDLEKEEKVVVFIDSEKLYVIVASEVE